LWGRTAIPPARAELHGAAVELRKNKALVTELRAVRDQLMKMSASSNAKAFNAELNGVTAELRNTNVPSVNVAARFADHLSADVLLADLSADVLLAEEDHTRLRIAVFEHSGGFECIWRYRGADTRNRMILVGHNGDSISREVT